MRIIIEIDGATGDTARVASVASVLTSAVALGASTDAAVGVTASQMTSTNAGPAPIRGGSTAADAASGTPAMNPDAPHNVGISAGAAPGAA